MDNIRAYVQRGTTPSPAANTERVYFVCLLLLLLLLPLPSPCLRGGALIPLLPFKGRDAVRFPNTFSSRFMVVTFPSIHPFFLSFFLLFSFPYLAQPITACRGIKIERGNGVIIDDIWKLLLSRLDR